MDYLRDFDGVGSAGVVGAADCFANPGDPGTGDQGEPGDGKTDAGRAWETMHGGTIHGQAGRGTEDDSAGADRDDASYRGRERGGEFESDAAAD